MAPDETYIKVRGQLMYLYRAVDSSGDAVEFWLSEHRDLSAAKRFFRKAFAWHGRPERIIIDGRQTNREAIIPVTPLTAFRHLNDRIEQDHRRIKRRFRPILGFKSFASATATLSGIEMLHMMRKRQARYCPPSVADGEPFFCRQRAF